MIYSLAPADFCSAHSAQRRSIAPLQVGMHNSAVDFHAWQNLAVSRSQLDVPAGPETESDKSKHALEDSLRASFEA